MECCCERFPALIALNIDGFREMCKIDFETRKRYDKIDILCCRDCGTKWMLDKTSTNNFVVKLLRPRQMELIEEWHQHDLSGTRFREIADSIGFIEAKNIEIPCMAILKSGEERDFCVLYKTSYHPEISWSTMPIKKVIYADDIEDIKPSAHALSLEHRMAIANAMEIRNLYAPVNLVINDRLYFRYFGGKKFLNLFFKYRKYDASSIVSVNQDMEKYRHPAQHEELTDTMTLILCDEI